MVKPGYKQTEIGVLPESWGTITFEDCFSILPNNTLSRAELNYNGGEVRNIHYGDILVKFPAVLDCSAEGLPYINKENVAKESKGFLRDGDLIMADTAEDVIVGKSTEVIGIGDRKVVSGLHTIPCRPKDAEMFAPKWLGYFINHCTYHDQLIPYITGIKVSSVSKSSISSTAIAVPPKLEQEAITEALSDIDALIVNLEKLIAKKKAIKQGAIQELLTGKRRLPGFSGDWIVVRLGDIADIRDGTHQTPHYVDDGIPFYSVETITNDDFTHTKFISMEEHLSLTASYKIECGDVLMTRIGSIGQCKYIDWNCEASFYVSLALLKFRGDSILAQYVAILSELSEFKKKVINNALQYAIPIKINLGQIGDVKITIPADNFECKEIVSILSDINNEINQLSSKLEKYRQIRKGMMSELLTGRIRLIDKEDA